MALSAETIARQLQKLLPRGAAWSRSLSSTLYRVLSAMAEELARVSQRVDDLKNEGDPRTTLELLEEWERELGLPDPCTPAGQTLQERRGAVLAKMTGRGGQSRQYYIDLAALLGYEITIREYKPFRCGVSRVGVDQLNPSQMRFVWRVIVPGPRVTHFRCGQSRVGTDPLLKISRAEDLECTFRRLKQSHTTLFFAYEGA